MGEAPLDLHGQLALIGTNMVNSVVTATPKIVAGVVVVALGLLASKLVAFSFRQVLVRARFDALLEKLGITAPLKKLGVQQPASQFLPKLTFYVLVLLLFQTVADSLGLKPISGAIGGFFAFLPNLCAAFLLLLFGSMAAQFAGGAVTRVALDSGMEFGPTLGRIVSSLVLFVIGMMAIAQLQIETGMVHIVTGGLLAGIAIAFGLSFGLGTREFTRNIIAGYYARKLFEPGERIEVRGQSGVLKAITPAYVLLEENGQTISIANSVLLDEIVKQ